METIAELCRRLWRSVKHSISAPEAAGGATGVAASSADRPETAPVEIPAFVEPLIDSVDISCRTREDLADGELDPQSLLHGIESYIGWKGAPGEDYYHSALVVPAWLKQECASGGFEWGRHLILTRTIERETTHRKLMAFLHEYCANSAGPPDEAEWKLGQLGHWDFEDIDSGMPGRPRWHISARLIDIWSPDAKLESFSPPGDFGIRVRVRIGAEGGIEADDDSAIFEFLLCTPDWLAKHRDLSQLLLCSNIAFMGTFDLEVLRRNVGEACGGLKGYTAEEAIRKMSRYGERIAM